MAQDLGAHWKARAARVDSLYVEGKVHHFRVPADQDAGDERNWVFDPKTCLNVDFRLWIRRPDFRIRVHNPPGERMREDTQEFAWVEGTMTSVGDLARPDGGWGAALRSDVQAPRFLLEPFLTPFEFHLFDWKFGSGPTDWLKQPYQVEANRITIELKPPDDGFWAAGAELDPQRHYCPTRLSLLIGSDPARRIHWDMQTLKTTDVDGLPVISLARIVLYNPATNPSQRVVYLYEASKIEKRPITRSDLEIEIPHGVTVTDMRDKNQWKTWVSGDPADPQDLDMEVQREVARAVQAQLVSPEIRAARKSAMTWIVGLGVGVGVVLTAMGLYIRRLRRG
ncbi:MAG: hypothetical protein BroJett003_18750 [Planctomycetota bacterium]|nr:MAG: hypothetical protein BroJett003_18750 [Planctomycetota bacterium]